jgi:hypothetical protein
VQCSGRLITRARPCDQCARCHGPWTPPPLLQRSGRRRELLTGPCLYGAVITALTLVYWRSSPAGPAAIAALCVGDGVADLAG